MSEILIEKKGKYIKFKRNEKEANFDLSLKKFIRILKNGTEKPLESFQNTFFSNTKLKDFIYEEGDNESESYLEYLKTFFDRNLKYNSSGVGISNMGTIIKKSSEQYYLEAYIKMGVPHRSNISQEITIYNKQFIKFIKENENILTIDSQLESNYNERKIEFYSSTDKTIARKRTSFYGWTIKNNETYIQRELDLGIYDSYEIIYTKKELYNFLVQEYYSKYAKKGKNIKFKGFLCDIITNDHMFNTFKKIVDEYSYNRSKLLEYIYDKIENGEFYMFYDESGCQRISLLTQLLDYANMQNLMTLNNYKKYPKNLLSSHEIAVFNYNKFKTAYDDQLFAKIYEKYEYLKYSPEEKKKKKEEDDILTIQEEFEIILPKNTDEIKLEGATLNHCVGSYINRILEQRSVIIFLRNKEKINSPLVTIEVIDDKLTQIRGHSNRDPNENEIEFIKKYMKEKNLTSRELK